MIIINILVLIPVIHKKQVMSKLSLPLLLIRTVNTVVQSHVTSAVFPQFLLPEGRQRLVLRLQMCTIINKSQQFAYKDQSTLSATILLI
jgi:energy-converting hydrogenase Eha subunit A